MSLCLYCNSTLNEDIHLNASIGIAAPKKTTEGLHKIKVGTSEVSTYGADAIETQRALNAPKKASENLGHVHKGAR